MKVNYLIISVLLSALFISSGCVETVKENSFQAVHVYTDLTDSLVKDVFKEFEKQSDIHVFMHFAPASYILENLKTEKWQSKADLVLLKNALDMTDLADEKILQQQTIDEDTVYWQPLFHNPFVFHFPLDTVPLFTSYGQLIRNKKARVDAKFIKAFDQWGNLIPSLKRNYLIFSLEEIQGKILYSDSIKDREALHVQIAPFSHYSKKDSIVFPDQYFKGAYGIIGGIGVVRQAKNRSNAQLLFAYCESPSWRKKLAKKINLFPIVNEEENKTRETLLYQSTPNLKDIKNSAE